MSNTVVCLQGNRAVFRIFIALLMFSFDSPSYLHFYKRGFFLIFQPTCRCTYVIFAKPSSAVPEAADQYLYDPCS